MKRIYFGFKTYFAGMRMWATHGSLLRLSVIPFILDLACLGYGLYFTISRLPDIIAHLVHRPEIWYQYLLYYLVLVVTAVSLFFAVIFLVFVIANLLAFPFNDLLAEKTLDLRLALPERKKGMKAWFRKSTKNISAMAKKTLILIVVGGLIVLATLVPGLGVVGAVVSVLLMAWDRVDYAFDHYQWTFKKRISFMLSHGPEMIGFAAALGLTTAIPVINMLVMPGSVVAGASLVAEFTKKEPRN